jgi:hypothetical protein
LESNSITRGVNMSLNKSLLWSFFVVALIVVCLSAYWDMTNSTRLAFSGGPSAEISYCPVSDQGDFTQLTLIWMDALSPSDRDLPQLEVADARKVLFDANVVQYKLPTGAPVSTIAIERPQSGPARFAYVTYKNNGKKARMCSVSSVFLEGKYSLFAIYADGTMSPVTTLIVSGGALRKAP